MFDEKSRSVDFHAEVSRVFHREVSHLNVMVFGSGWRQGMTDLLLFSGRCCRAGLEAKAVVAGFHDVAAMGEAVQQSGGHFGIHCPPLAHADMRCRAAGRRLHGKRRKGPNTVDHSRPPRLVVRTAPGLPECKTPGELPAMAQKKVIEAVFARTPRTRGSAAYGTPRRLSERSGAGCDRRQA